MATSTQSDLNQIMAVLWPSNDVLPKVKIYSDIARRLTLISNNRRVWSWRYVQSVISGTVDPSPHFAHAVELLALRLDGVPPQMADAEPVQVMARAGQVRPGALVLGSSKQCADPTCTIVFIPRVPWQRFCPRHAKK